jgi:hypothetical protein
MNRDSHRCSCGRSFATENGLGTHWAWLRRKNVADRAKHHWRINDEQEGKTMSKRILTSRESALAVVEGYGRDVLTGTAPGISLADMIEVAIDDAVANERERSRTPCENPCLEGGCCPRWHLPEAP